MKVDHVTIIRAFVNFYIEVILHTDVNRQTDDCDYDDYGCNYEFLSHGFGINGYWLIDEVAVVELVGAVDVPLSALSSLRALIKSGLMAVA